MSTQHHILQWHRASAAVDHDVEPCAGHLRHWSTRWLHTEMQAGAVQAWPGLALNKWEKGSRDMICQNIPGDTEHTWNTSDSLFSSPSLSLAVCFCHASFPLSLRVYIFPCCSQNHHLLLLIVRLLIGCAATVARARIIMIALGGLCCLPLIWVGQFVGIREEVPSVQPQHG